MKSVIAIALFAAACGTGTEPNHDPLPTWGVPISGGSMITSKDGTRAIVADPDRDRVTITELASGATTELPLEADDEPGRLVEDAAGRIHIALRRGAAVLTIQDGAVVSRRPVCAEPRGIAFDASTDNLLVACATGELVTLPAAGGDVTRSVFVDRDLRDVVIVGTTTYVSRFRSAQVLQLDGDGAITRRIAIPDTQRFDSGGFEDAGGGMIPARAAVAWRMIPLADGTIAVLHQRGIGRMLSTQQGGYGGFGCGSAPIESTITTITPAPDPVVTVHDPIAGSLPVDLASNSGQLAVALAGNQTVAQLTVAQLSPDSNTGCPGFGGTSDNFGAPTAVAYANANTLVTFYPELPGLVVQTNGVQKRVITLPGELGYDAGRNMFHRETQAGIACASCHPEGRDDGLVWDFQELGPRRTQVLAGDLLKRAPYHWTGDELNLPALMDDVFAVRMGGGTPTTSEHRSLGPWLQRVPAPAPIAVADRDAVERGKALFEDASTLCATCHTGELMTTKAVVDVGTGGKFKVPSLVGVGARAPFIHDGCAATLADRFGAACGGGDAHGKTSQLTAAQVSDLVAYLESL